MTGRGWKIVGWVAGIVTGLGVTGVGVFFAVTGVDDANRWSGVLGFFVGVLGLAVAVYSAVLTRRSLTPPTVPPPSSSGSNVDNTISGGTFHQPAVQARDITGLSIGSPATPAGPAPTRPADAGEARNTISGGTFHQPAVQARDITGLSSAPPGTSSGPQPGTGRTT